MKSISYTYYISSQHRVLLERILLNFFPGEYGHLYTILSLQYDGFFFESARGIYIHKSEEFTAVIYSSSRDDL
jgi:hypothetical protein